MAMSRSSGSAKRWQRPQGGELSSCLLRDEPCGVRVEDARMSMTSVAGRALQWMAAAIDIAIRVSDAR